jgi:TonB family protein
MYFEFEDYKPDITPVGSVISWREGVLLSVIVHLAGVIVILMSPQIFEVNREAILARQAAMDAARPKQDPERFVFVEPRVDMKADKPPERAEPSDQDREKRSPERAKEPTNPLPFSRGNTRDRVEQMNRETARGQGPTPDPAAGQQAQAQPEAPPAPPSQNQLPLPDSQAAVQLPAPKPNPQQGANGQRPLGGGSLGDALRNLQRYVQRDQFENSQGGGAFGPAIQFDTKGVEFGPWIRRFVAQVKRNWLIPYAAMTSSGHVVVTFNVHKDGSITDLQVIGPSSIGAFNSAAFGALATSNPTAPLPPEYPSEKAFFTVTFFYNEEPQ